MIKKKIKFNWKLLWKILILEEYNNNLEYIGFKKV